MKIVLATPGDYADIIALYAEAGYGAGIGPADTVVVAKVGSQLLGVVRLCPEQGVTVLRGMQIRSDHQRQGIGGQLLAACLPHLDQCVSFCLPYSHLVSFYSAAGFVMTRSASLPDFLARRLASYLANGKDVIAMQRLDALAGAPRPSDTLAQRL